MLNFVISLHGLDECEQHGLHMLTASGHAREFCFNRRGQCARAQTHVVNQHQHLSNLSHFNRVRVSVLMWQCLPPSCTSGSNRATSDALGSEAVYSLR